MTHTTILRYAICLHEGVLGILAVLTLAQARSSVRCGSVAEGAVLVALAAFAIIGAVALDVARRGSGL